MSMTRPRLTRLSFLALLGLLAVVALARLPLATWPERLPIFVTIFLGVFIEALPFLVIGSLASGLVEAFVDQQTLARLIPRQPLLMAATGALMGFAFPVCECGVVPLTRRMQKKGMPLSMGVAFLLAAPVVNPVVIASTYAAFGWGPVLYGRLGATFLIATATGLLFHLARPEEALLPPSDARGGAHDHEADHGHGGPRIRLALATAGDDFLDMIRYLIAGSMVAAAMQTAIPQSALLALGSGPVVSVLVMMALAFVLSICSTVDAFLALAFVNTFTTGSILAFLVFGPMVDIKSALMFLALFRRRTVAYLILLPLMMTLLIAIFINLNIGG
jgi:uncharacterized membrane protein YraQ (UPF0718 family)